MEAEWTPVPGHINETTGMFCDREGELAPNGRCPDGCDHADHYSNDGHPECEDEPTPTEWVVWCAAHKHYLKFASAGGTTWTQDRAEAKGYSKRQAIEAANTATWLDHNPTPWAIAGRTAR